MKKDYEDLYAIKVVLKEKLFSEGIKLRVGEGEFPYARFINMMAESFRKEQRPLRKYRISKNLTKFLDQSKEYSFSSRKHLIDRIFESDSKFGIVYHSDINREHFLYSIEDKKYIILFIFKNSGIENLESFFLGYKQIIGPIVIDRDNIPENYSDCDCGLIMSDNDKASHIVKEFLNKGVDIRKLMTDMNILNHNDYVNSYYNLIKNEFNEEIAELCSISNDKYNCRLKAFETFLFLMTSEIKTETFESIVAGKVKNPPTKFEDPLTGRRNQGIIVVDKTYNHEIIVDHPFGVREHWRNQYRGRDKYGNPIHERILIHSFEKKGYHRKAKKEILEKEKRV